MSDYTPTHTRAACEAAIRKMLQVGSSPDYTPWDMAQAIAAVAHSILDRIDDVAKFGDDALDE